MIANPYTFDLPRNQESRWSTLQATARWSGDISVVCQDRNNTDDKQTGVDNSAVQDWGLPECERSGVQDDKSATGELLPEPDQLPVHEIERISHVLQWQEQCGRAPETRTLLCPGEDWLIICIIISFTVPSNHISLTYPLMSNSTYYFGCSH